MLILFTLLSDNFNPGLFNPILFNPTAQTFMIEKLMIETSGVEKFRLALRTVPGNLDFIATINSLI